MRLNRLSNTSWLPWTPRTTITTKGPSTTMAEPRNHNTTKSTTTTSHPLPHKEADRKIGKLGKMRHAGGKICKPKIRLCKVELSILYGVRWAGHGIRIWVTCLPNTCWVTPLVSTYPPRLHPRHCCCWLRNGLALDDCSAAAWNWCFCQFCNWIAIKAMTWNRKPRVAGVDAHFVGAGQGCKRKSCPPVLRRLPKPRIWKWKPN